jgi:chromosome segregation ATPase
VLKNDIIATTLTEISLVLAYAVIIIFYFSSNVNINAALKNAKSMEDDIIRKDGQLMAAENEIRTIRDEIESLKDEDRNNRNTITDLNTKFESASSTLAEIQKKSKQIPSCIEKKITDKFLSKILILGADIYSVENFNYSFAGILVKFKNENEIAKTNECRHSVDTFTRKNISVEDYDQGLRKLESVFYVKRSGVQ